MLLLMLLGIGVTAIMPGIDRRRRRCSMAFFSVLALFVGAIMVDVIIYRNPELYMLGWIITYIEYVLICVLMLILTVYLLQSCGENWRSSPVFRTVAILCLAYFIMLNINQFTRLFYDISPETLFYRTPWHALLLSPLCGILILDLINVIGWRDRLTRKHFNAYLIYLVPMAIAMIVYVFVYVPMIVDLSLALWALVMFGIILSDQIDQYKRQRREIAHQQASIMVLQMRPHFIHNTMTSIYYLCDLDPQKAKQVTMDFNTYLRRNFTAIASDHTIPFTEELEHTRAYLAVEQAQFEDRLFVDYDTPLIDFRVPPLTLQPIVENAVKHGMDPDSEPLHISIRTRKTDSGSEILVKDDGPGYDPADDSEPHIALPNIRERLELMCGGRLEISPRDGGGTVVRILVP